MLYRPSPNTQNQCQGGVVIPNEGGIEPSYRIQCTSIQNVLLPWPGIWDHISLHCLPLHTKMMKNKYFLTNMTKGNISAIQIKIKNNWSTNAPASIVKLKKIAVM